MHPQKYGDWFIAKNSLCGCISGKYIVFAIQKIVVKVKYEWDLMDYLCNRAFCRYLMYKLNEYSRLQFYNLQFMLLLISQFVLLVTGSIIEALFNNFLFYLFCLMYFYYKT
eukprot:527238_1